MGPADGYRRCFLAGRGDLFGGAVFEDLFVAIESLVEVVRELDAPRVGLALECLRGLEERELGRRLIAGQEDLLQVTPPEEGKQPCPLLLVDLARRSGLLGEILDLLEPIGIVIAEVAEEPQV